MILRFLLICSLSTLSLSLSISSLSLYSTVCIDDPRSTRAIEEEQIIYECINLHDVEEIEQDQKERTTRHQFCMTRTPHKRNILCQVVIVSRLSR